MKSTNSTKQKHQMENEKHKAMAEKEYPLMEEFSFDDWRANEHIKTLRKAFIAGLNKNEGLVSALEITRNALINLYPHCHELNMKGESEYEKAWLKCEDAIHVATKNLVNYTEALTQYKEGKEPGEQLNHIKKNFK